jgi:cytochrome c heme-lyase
MAGSTDQATCPVDPKTREVWLAQARAKAAQSQPSLPPDHPPVSTSTTTTTATNDAADACPVDHRTREAWLQQSRATPAPSLDPNPSPASRPLPSAGSWSPSSWLPSLWSTAQPADARSSSLNPQPHDRSALGNEREVSSIPRSSTPGSTACPANTEVETGVDAGSGNWIYPSERMFFEAMKRKGHDPTAADMQTVVPIHNAVNERAWKEIREWEEPWLRGLR